MFISSTCEDLKPYREAARDAALAAGFRPVMQEYFEATANPPVPECLERVAGCHVLVAIIAHRYGWVPESQGQGGKNITWLECEHALHKRKEVLAFVLDKDVKWPAEFKESYRIAAATEGGIVSQGLINEVNRNVNKLAEFRQWLSDGRIRATFNNPDDLRSKILSALYSWRERQQDRRAVKRPGVQAGVCAGLFTTGMADTSDALEQTMSNPHYTSDLRTLEVEGFASLAMIGEETIMVVVGTRIDAELFDRPLAEALRDIIDKKGFPDPSRRAIVVSDVEWYRNERLRCRPSISVGGPITNSLTKELNISAPPDGKWIIGLNRLHGAFVAKPVPRVALWGPFHHDTRRAVERYMERREGLDSFLELCWR